MVPSGGLRRSLSLTASVLLTLAFALLAYVSCSPPGVLVMLIGRGIYMRKGAAASTSSFQAAATSGATVSVPKAAETTAKVGAKAALAWWTPAPVPKPGTTGAPAWGTPAPLPKAGTAGTAAPGTPAPVPKADAAIGKAVLGSSGEKKAVGQPAGKAAPAAAPALPEPICAHSPFHWSAGECVLIGKDQLCSGTTPRVSDLPADSRYHRCLRRGSCAIIGSSSHLLSEKWGPLIDSHDTVIRINSGPAGMGKNSHWAKHVGSTTHVRFANQFGVANLEENGMPVCQFLHEPDIRCPGRCWLTPSLCRLRDCNFAGQQCRAHGQRGPVPWSMPGDKRTVILDSVHADVADRILRGSKKVRTAGMIGFSYAIHACDHVSVFGFGPGCDGKLGARYYQNSEAVQMFHGYDFETKVFINATNGLFTNNLPSNWVRAKTVKYYWPKCLKRPPGLKAR
mmetsp:Transcript_16907/g.48268  ORF Transcript_16907/g.48268 Transcript_16907/m.48268 type:complete len:452 (+) Transcript_16907:50-1405(+)